MRRHWWKWLIMWLLLWKAVAGATRGKGVRNREGSVHKVHTIVGLRGEGEWISEQYMALLRIRKMAVNSHTRKPRE